MLWICVAILFCGCLIGVTALYAEDTAASTTEAVTTAATETTTSATEATTATAGSSPEMSWKEQWAADKEAIKTKKSEIKGHATTARADEKALREQIRDAKKAGDNEKVKELRAQLKTKHQENVRQMRQDKKQLNATKKELKKDRKAKRHSR